MLSGKRLFHFSSEVISLPTSTRQLLSSSPDGVKWATEPYVKSQTTSVSPGRTCRCCGYANSPGPRPSRPIDPANSPEGSKRNSFFSLPESTAILPSERGATSATDHTR